MAVVGNAIAAPRRPRERFSLDHADFLGALLVAPAILFILALVAVPFFLALYYAFSAYNIGTLSFSFVGLQNFIDVTQSAIFQRTLVNTFIFTFASNAIALVLGKITALILLRPFRGRMLVRCLVILPWAVPVALAAITWRWMLDSQYSVINWVMVHTHLVDPSVWPNWLGEEDLAMISVILIQAWRLFPFSAIIFLAGLTSVPKTIIDASYIDGAGYWRRTFQIVLPVILPIMMVAMLFGLVFTFTDMSVVYLLTKGGPTNSTQVLGSLAFQVGILSGDVGRGAAISLYLFPFLLVASYFLLRYLRRREI
ncbi:MAG TPA: sugar ABC transporter permease [Burkholderiales bacterium]|nr:sugar ABC transporter permease [Burkholderiales bacterium]